MHRGTVWGTIAVVLAAGVGIGIWFWHRGPDSTPPDDRSPLPKDVLEQKRAEPDYFKGMDGGIELSPEETKGRNTWFLWTAGNEQFWDRMAQDGNGITDLLKTVDSRRRGERFKSMGLVNEPGFEGSSEPDASRFGLYLDRPAGGATGPVPDPELYGMSSGVMGLRLYRNPAFDERAKSAWDPKRFYEDASYYTKKDLVRPFRVGMTCAFCHVAPHPLHPPADPESPRFEDMASLIGNQYLREGSALAIGVHEGDFLKEMFEAQPPGTSDTSRLATDHVNNPNTMNGIFLLGARLRLATRERLTGGGAAFAGTSDADVNHVLKDGADSVGAREATVRVFVNIGCYSQYWLTCHDVLTGLRPQRPFEVEVARAHSDYWVATEARSHDLVKFFLRIGRMPLADAPGGPAHLTKDAEVLRLGRRAFAQTCATCHSSKRPPDEAKKSAAEIASWFEQAVEDATFLDDNFLSNERRYPVTEVGTNAARALATNATKGHVWDNFSSQTYKDLPSVGTITGQIPADLPGGEGAPAADGVAARPFDAPAGGVGYYRVPSLVAVWSSAPLLHNNALGTFTGDPSVEGRLRAFDDAAEKLLWPEKRLGAKSVWRTKRESWITLPADILPRPLPKVFERLHLLDSESKVKIGPIPAGMPINLLGSLDPSVREIVHLAPDVVELFAAIRRDGKDSPEVKAKQRELVPKLLKASRCPDFVEDRGHEYGTSLPDAEKKALIEYMKTF